MIQSSSKQKKKDQSLRFQSIAVKNQCSICKKVGNYQSWTVCCQDNLKVFCVRCLRKKKIQNVCPVSNCNSPSKCTILHHLLEERRFWYQKVECMINFKAKLENSLPYFTKLQKPTYNYIHQLIKDYLMDEKINGMKHFQNYMSFFTQYMVKLKSPQIKQIMMNRIEIEDKKLELVELEYYKILNLLVCSSPDHILQKKVYEIPEVLINCGVCYLQRKTKHVWKYCRENHPQFQICNTCINKIESCPLCRKQMRKNTIKVCQASYEKWISSYKQALSLSDTSQKLIRSKMSVHTIQAMCDKVSSMTFKTITNLQKAFQQLLQNWIFQWIKQKQRYQQVIYLIVVSDSQYIQSYDKVKNHEKYTLQKVKRQLKSRKQQQIQMNLLRQKQKGQKLNSKQQPNKQEGPINNWSKLDERVNRWRKNRQRSNSKPCPNQRQRSREDRFPNYGNGGLIFPVNRGPAFQVDY